MKTVETCPCKTGSVEENVDKTIKYVCMAKQCDFQIECSRFICEECKEFHRFTCEAHYFLSIQDFSKVLKSLLNLNMVQLEKMKNLNSDHFDLYQKLQSMVQAGVFSRDNIHVIHKICDLFDYQYSIRKFKNNFLKYTIRLKQEPKSQIQSPGKLNQQSFKEPVKIPPKQQPKPNQQESSFQNIYQYDEDSDINKGSEQTTVKLSQSQSSQNIIPELNQGFQQQQEQPIQEQNQFKENDQIVVNSTQQSQIPQNSQQGENSIQQQEQQPQISLQENVQQSVQPQQVQQPGSQCSQQQQQQQQSVSQLDDSMPKSTEQIQFQNQNQNQNQEKVRNLKDIIKVKQQEKDSERPDKIGKKQKCFSEMCIVDKIKKQQETMTRKELYAMKRKNLGIEGYNFTDENVDEIDAVEDMIVQFGGSARKTYENKSGFTERKLQKLRQKYKNIPKISYHIFNQKAYTFKEYQQIVFNYEYGEEGNKVQKLKEEWNLDKSDIEIQILKHSYMLQQYKQNQKLPYDQDDEIISFKILSGSLNLNENDKNKNKNNRNQEQHSNILHENNKCNKKRKSQIDPQYLIEKYNPEKKKNHFEEQHNSVNRQDNTVVEEEEEEEEEKQRNNEENNQKKINEMYEYYQHQISQDQSFSQQKQQQPQHPSEQQQSQQQRENQINSQGYQSQQEIFSQGIKRSDSTKLSIYNNQQKTQIDQGQNQVQNQGQNESNVEQINYKQKYEKEIEENEKLKQQIQVLIEENKKLQKKEVRIVQKDNCVPNDKLAAWMSLDENYMKFSIRELENFINKFDHDKQNEYTKYYKPQLILSQGDIKQYQSFVQLSISKSYISEFNQDSQSDRNEYQQFYENEKSISLLTNSYELSKELAEFFVKEQELHQDIGIYEIGLYDSFPVLQLFFQEEANYTKKNEIFGKIQQKFPRNDIYQFYGNIHLMLEAIIDDQIK